MRGSDTVCCRDLKVHEVLESPCLAQALLVEAIDLVLPNKEILTASEWRGHFSSYSMLDYSSYEFSALTIQ